jgi:beta-barrel assembly-enhancing protease
MRGSRRQFMMGVGGCAACMSGLANARVLPTDLESLIPVGYEPSDPDERGIWQSIEQIEEMIQTSPQLLQAPELHAYTKAIVERLVGRPTPDLRLYLMRNSAFNASMFPSGMMIVHTGLMARVRNEAQLAAVLGHEAGHFFRKHSIDQYRSIRGKSAAMAWLSTAASVGGGAYSAGGYGGAGNWMYAAQAINMAVTMSVFQFSRTHEAEADAYGISLMSRCGYSPYAAAEVWKQLIEERKASAAQRDKRYSDRSKSVLSTHPPTDDRMQDLSETAEYLSSRKEDNTFDGRAEWLAAVAPHRAMLLDEQVRVNDPGASLYLIESLAQDGWTGLLRYNEGEIYRLRGESGDQQKSAEAYAAATAMPDAPSEAWRAHGYALLKAGKAEDGRVALNRYLELNPTAKDAGLVRFTLAQ